METKLFEKGDRVRGWTGDHYEVGEVVELVHLAAVDRAGLRLLTDKGLYLSVEERQCELLVKPRVGMSASMGIGSDSYHEVVVGVERNAKVLRTVSAGLFDKTFFGLSEAAREAEALEMYKVVRKRAQLDADLLLGVDTDIDKVGWSLPWHLYTLRGDGLYRQLGAHYWGAARLHVGSTYEYMDPSF